MNRRALSRFLRVLDVVLSTPATGKTSDTLPAGATVGLLRNNGDASTSRKTRHHKSAREPQADWPTTRVEQCSDDDRLSSHGIERLAEANHTKLDGVSRA